VHVVTVNDYLARATPSGWGASTIGWASASGVVVPQQSDSPKKQAAYRADITYGQNNEFGFDYLRDNMKFSITTTRSVRAELRDRGRGRLDPRRRGAHPADHLGRGQQVASEKYIADRQGHAAPPQGRALRQLDEKNHSVAMTEEGIELAQSLLATPRSSRSEPLRSVNLEALHILQQSLRAQHPLQARPALHGHAGSEGGHRRRVHGARAAGRRWSDGLHQAVEAKEGVPIQAENRTLATISFQNSSGSTRSSPA
jgi:preprotein translocase subunit SecA